MILMIADLLIVSVCYLVTWMMLMGRISLHGYLPTMVLSGGVFIVVFFFVFLLFGMYESLWRYAEAYEFFKCCIAAVVSSATFVIIDVYKRQLHAGTPWHTRRRCNAGT